MNKDLIQKRFARSLETYNNSAKVQRRMADKLLGFLDGSGEFSDILELGCGTGFLTQCAVKEIKNFKSYTAIDIVENCRRYIKNIDDSIEFVCADAETFESGKKYDLILSNAFFQWIDNTSDMIDKLMQKLNPNGVLLFSTFGKENFREIFLSIGKTLPYKSKQELENMIGNYRHEIEEEIYVLSFKTPLEVLKHLKSTGVNSLESSAWTKRDMFKFEEEYNNYCLARPTLTYNPIYVKILNSLK